MNALAEPPPARSRERDRLTVAHHEICTALTVFRSNIDLVRNQLEDVASADKSVPIRVHLGEIEAAIERLHAIAHEMKRWHDETA